MKVEALVFDMDGLLLDSERVVQRSWNYAGEKLGYGRDRKSTRLNSSHKTESRMPSSA